MAQIYAAPAALSTAGPVITLTGTGPTDRIASLGGQLRVSGVLDWDEFCRSLLDPEDWRWNQPNAICLAFVSFEDWDHFSDHIRDPSIEPSYALVKKKTGDLTRFLSIAANQSASHFAILVQWSSAAKQCAHIDAFFTEVTRNLEDAFDGYSNVTVARHWRKELLGLPGLTGSCDPL